MQIHSSVALQWPFLAKVVLALVCFSGCSGEQYQPMSGDVTFNGQPLEKGVITFFPLGAGSTVGGEVIDGKFEISTERGATPGNYRVEIIAFRPTGRKEFDIDLQKNVDIEMQYLPSKYNGKSELKAEVTAGGENHFKFGLEP